jgi:hypothetical protein
VRNTSVVWRTTAATLISVTGQTLALGAQAGTSAAPILASVTAPAGTTSITPASIGAAAGATVDIYSASDFATGHNAAIALVAGGTVHVYVKVTAEDGVTVRYYDVAVALAAIVPVGGGGAVAVPTLTPTPLALLTLALGGMAAVAGRRRRRASCGE